MSTPASAEDPGAASSVDFDVPDLDIVREIDKFLEEYNSDGAEHTDDTSNFPDELVDDLLKNVDIADLEMNSKTVGTNELGFVGQSPAVLHLEDCVEYDYSSINETNWKNVYETFPLNKQDHSVKQDMKNDGFISNADIMSKIDMGDLFSSYENFQDSNIQQTLVKDKQLSTIINQQNQGNTFLEEISGKMFPLDELKEIDNFSFLQNCNNQEDFTTIGNAFEQFVNNSAALDGINTNIKSDNNLSIFSNKNDNIQTVKNDDIQSTINDLPNNNNHTFQNQGNKSNKKNKKKEEEKNCYSNSQNNPLSKNWSYKKKARLNRMKNWKRNYNDESFQYNSKKKYSSNIPYSHSKPPFTQPKNSKLKSNKPFYAASKQPEKKKQGKNEYNNDMPIVRNNNEFHNSNIGNYRPAFSNIRNICTSTMRSSSDDDSNKSHGSLNPYDSNKQNRNIPDMNLVHYDNEPHLNLPYYENEQHFLQNFQNHIDSSVLPVQQHSSHVAKLQYPQICMENKVISPQQNHENIKKSKILLHYVIKDHLLPESLNGKTVKFSSKKLINTRTRSEIEIALKTHGVLENSWWTPDDMFFARYTLEDKAQFVYEMYLKY